MADEDLIVDPIDPVDPIVATEPVVEPIEPAVESDEDAYSKRVDEIGGKDAFDEAMEMYSTYTATPEEFDPAVFNKALAKHPERYEAVLTDMVETHRDWIIKDFLKINQDSLADYQKWVGAGRPSAGSSEIDEAALEASDDEKDKYLLRMIRQDKARGVEEGKRKEEIERYTKQQNDQKVKQISGMISAGIDEVITRDIPKNLGDDKYGKFIAKAIHATAMMNFHDDPHGAKLYRDANSYAEARDEKLAKARLTPIQKYQERHTKEAVEILSELLQAKRIVDGQKAGKAATVVNPPAGGMIAPPASAQGDSNGALFDPKSQLAKLKLLKVERGL